MLAMSAFSVLVHLQQDIVLRTTTSTCRCHDHSDHYNHSQPHWYWYNDARQGEYTVANYKIFEPKICKWLDESGSRMIRHHVILNENPCFSPLSGLTPRRKTVACNIFKKTPAKSLAPVTKNATICIEAPATHPALVHEAFFGRQWIQGRLGPRPNGDIK